MSYDLDKKKAQEFWNYPNTRIVKARIKKSGIEVEVVRNGSIGFFDRSGKFYDFYEVEFINPKNEK